MPWLLVLAAVMTLLTACQQPPASHPSVSKAASPAEQLKSEGDAFMAKADYVSAIEKYRQAADLDPTAIGPRFGLGTANSFLEKRPEAVMQFRYIINQGGCRHHIHIYRKNLVVVSLDQQIPNRLQINGNALLF